MGKTLKFPSRKKYVPKVEQIKKVEDQPITEEEHQARLDKLREIGLLK